MERVYLDNNSTTPMDTRVAECMHQAMLSTFGNPSSVHSYGQEARAQLARARRTIAKAFSVKPTEVVFTSGGTEGLNLLIRGLLGSDFSSKHVVSSDLEHAAVFNTLRQLESGGLSVSYLSGGSWGAVTAEQVKEAIQANTRLIVLTAANNETGVKTDIEAIAKLAKEVDIPFLVDGVAFIGKETFVIPDGVSAVTMSGHKFHASKGTGLFILKKGIAFQPCVCGGGQEGQKRSGTENLPGILGLVKAIELIQEEMPAAQEKMLELREHLEKRLKDSLDSVHVNGEGPRISNTANIAFEGVDGESLLMHLDMNGVATSHGSACSSGALEPSRVLMNMGYPRERAASSLRFSVSRMTSKEEVDQACDVIIALVNELKQACRTSSS